MKAIICTIPSDSHSWNLVFMDLYLKEKGFQTKNLGVCTAAADLVQQVRSFKPDMVVISSVNGHAHLEAPLLINSLREHRLLDDLHIVVGGKLGIKGNDNTEYKAPLLALGFDAVFVDMKNNDGIADFGNFIDAKMAHLLEMKRYA